MWSGQWIGAKRVFACFALALGIGCGRHVHVGAAGSGEAAPIFQAAAHANVTLFGVGARGGSSSEFSYLALGPELAFAPGELVFPEFAMGKNKRHRKRKWKPSDHFSPSVHVGVHALQWDWMPSAPQFGAGSPYINLGGNYCHQRRPDHFRCIGLSFDAAHHVRFGADNQTWVGASLVLSDLLQWP